ncbi:3-methyl-2-oxobutanoate hydroxymethyltransferase [Coprinopsis sp. MPI-PUGE-AT-0042]|nr:3-methyl-2-oxobutanoate hydroxymethyltransferase [Coprinopsis sp. MPI-PUGE-AT-0042]
MHLDPSLQALLKDVDIALSKQKFAPNREQKELTEIAIEGESLAVEQEEPYEHDLERKSPAALFGSQKIGQVVIPQQLQDAITEIINASDKSQLHSDAKRLFADFDAEGDEAGWQVELDTKYRSRKQGERHAERDAIAFTSVVLSAHFSAVTAVFEHMKHRLGPSFEVERVVDWGAGAGTGLWTSLFSFQRHTPSHQPEMVDIEASNSTLRSYTGIDRRQAMLLMARRIADSVPTSEALSIQFRKNFLVEEDQTSQETGTKTLALAAFTLSSLPTTIARKALVKQMWESGAHTLVLIDHNTKEGFEVIGQAREFLLRQGRKETEKKESDTIAETENTETESSSSLRGSYVVAPCPHDGACPILTAVNPRLVCGFSQRMQRPDFVRKTKHSGKGHEDVGYSYVVIQRGSRPTATEGKVGRTGLVAQWDEEAKASKILKELKLFDEKAAPVPEEASAEVAEVEPPASELEETLRQEAYHWPRLVVPPMKKSGHIILDSCTSEGKIMRITIPKSQGKQPYYDARKSSWGDIFPHPPKNAPHERSVSGRDRSLKYKKKASKDRDQDLPQRKYSEHLATSIREAKKSKRRWQQNVDSSTIWGKEDY